MFLDDPSLFFDNASVFLLSLFDNFSSRQVAANLVWEGNWNGHFYVDNANDINKLIIKYVEQLGNPNFTPDNTWLDIFK